MTIRIAGAVVRVAVLVAPLAAAVPVGAAIPEPVKVEGGLVTGTPSWGWGVRLYRGIPFAAPPVGNLRWRPPQPVVPWTGVRAADRFGASCMQRQRPLFEAPWNDGSQPYSEDCLYLNLWTPAESAGDKLPVMVWIYGGGGTEGSGSEGLYDGNGLAKKGVVVVSFNYRVNVFGWLAHPELSRESEHHSSGNYGALDQVAALRWVKSNVAAFGGDPDKVTVFGESGGSRSVNWLMASPLARGLFRAAIAESHTVFGRMATLAEAETQGQAFAQGASTPSLAALRALPAAVLEAAALKNPAGMTGTVVDGWFLPADIHTLFATGRQNDVPLITGGTSDESGLGRGSPAPGSGLGGYLAWARSTFGEQAEALLKLYPARTDAEAAKAYHDVARDTNFVGHRTWTKLQATTGKAPAYLYLFSHAPPQLSANRNNHPPLRGAAHGSEILYVFDNLRYTDWPWTETDGKVADLLSTYWTNFAKTGDPNGPGVPRWPAYDAKDERFVNVGDVVRVETIAGAALDFLAAREEGRRQGGSTGR